MPEIVSRRGLSDARRERRSRADPHDRRLVRRSISRRTSPRSKRRDCSCAIDRPINKDTELHPLVRWQFQGGLAEDQRRAFLFTNVIGSAGRRYDIPVAVGALAASPQIYAVGMGRPVEEIEAAWVHAIANPIAPIACHSPPCQAVVISGDELRGPGSGLGAPAGADLDAGLRCRALSHRDALRHARSRHRHPEHGHLSRRA